MAMTETTENAQRDVAIIPNQEERAFELSQREAIALSKSELIPKPFQGRTADCLIAINLARRIKADPLMVLQNLDVIHGRPSFRASFLISCFNSTGEFTRLRYRFEGEGDERTCVAFANDKQTGEEYEGPPVSIAMAQAEGWATKNGSKWKTLPDLMLRYRAAAFFIRTTAPEIAMGLYTSDEVRDMGNGSATSGETARSASEAIMNARDVTPDDPAPTEGDPIHDEEPPDDYEDTAA